MSSTSQVGMSPNHRRRRQRPPAAATSTFTSCCFGIAAILLLSFIPTQVSGSDSAALPRSTARSPAYPESISRRVSAAKRRTSTKQQQWHTDDQSSGAQVEVSTEVEEEEASVTSQQSSDEASKYVVHHIDGYGSITSCNDNHSGSSAGRDIEGSTAQSDYETIDLEIKFDYQMELISLASEENSSGAYNELVATTERTMHQAMVDDFLNCGSPDEMERHGMDRKRHLATVAEAQSASPRIVGISSAPMDVISPADLCTSVHTTKDACVVVNAAATVTVEMDGITNSKLLSAAIDAIRSNILKKIGNDMKQGHYDERYGRNVFAKISFIPNHIAPPLLATSSSLPEKEAGNDAHDPSETVATSLREESHTRHRRRNMRAIVVVIGMLTIALVFKLVSYNKELRSKRSSKGKKSWSWRGGDTTGDTNIEEGANESRKKEQAKMPKYESSFGGSDSNASVIIEEEEENDESQSEHFEENESTQDSIEIDGDDDDWTYDAIGRQASLEMLDLESGADATVVDASEKSMDGALALPSHSNSKSSHFRALHAFLDREASAHAESNIKGTGPLQMTANGQIRMGFEEAWETFDNCV